MSLRCHVIEDRTMGKCVLTWTFIALMQPDSGEFLRAIESVAYCIAKYAGSAKRKSFEQ